MIRRWIEYWTEPRPRLERDLDEEILERAGRSGALAILIVIVVGLAAVCIATRIYPWLFDYKHMLYR